MIRKMGTNGRVVIPNSITEDLGIKAGDKILFKLIDNKIIITTDKSINQELKIKWALEYLENIDDAKIKNDLKEILGA